MLNSSSFTLRSPGGLLRVLQSSCKIAAAFDPLVFPHPTLHEFQAIWDTGATNSLVTQNVVDLCGLLPTGQAQVQGVNSSGIFDAYLVNIALPNNVGFRSIRVTKGLLGAGADVLIGMDVITKGDFAVTNQNGKTVFSYCWPSHRCIDFVEEHNRLMQSQQRRQPQTSGKGPPPSRFRKTKRR